MKFHHLGQLLLDTNCLLLILKMFGLQEVSASVVSKADSPENGELYLLALLPDPSELWSASFRYCQASILLKAAHPNRPEDDILRAPRQTMTRTNTLPNGLTHLEDVELITEFSWRNFFSTINFAKIMQKLSKNRSHRIWMLILITRAR